jgi:hypothetical protein
MDPHATTERSNEKSLSSDGGALQGRTIRFSFSEGPTKGVSYDHVFADDGTVTFRDAAKSDRKEPRTPEAPAKYASFEVADDITLVSYLSSSGYTLTVALNFETEELFGFASNHEHWYPVRGTFEVRPSREH